MSPPTVGGGATENNLPNSQQPVSDFSFTSDANRTGESVSTENEIAPEIGSLPPMQILNAQDEQSPSPPISTSYGPLEPAFEPTQVARNDRDGGSERDEERQDEPPVLVAEQGITSQSPTNVGGTRRLLSPGTHLPNTARDSSYSNGSNSPSPSIRSFNANPSTLTIGGPIVYQEGGRNNDAIPSFPSEATLSMPQSTTHPTQPTVQQGLAMPPATAFFSKSNTDEHDIEELADDAESHANQSPVTIDFTKAGRPSVTQDIVIPARLMSVASWNTRRSADSTPRLRRSTVLSKTSREDFDIQRIAREQSYTAQQALNRSIDDINPPTPLQEAHLRGGSRTISFALPPPPSQRFGGSATSDLARSSFKRKSTTTGHEQAGSRPFPIAPRPFWTSDGTGNNAPTEKIQHLSPGSPTTPLPARRPTRIAWANANPFAATTTDAQEGEAADVIPSGDILARNSQAGVKEHADNFRMSEVRKRSTLRTSTAPPRPSNADSMFAIARRGTVARVGSVFQSAAQGVTDVARRMSLFNLYEKAKVRGVELQRSRRFQLFFEYSIYLLLVAFVYLVLVGMPIWKGAVYWLYILIKFKFVVEGTWSITIGIAFFYAFAPLCILFEKDPPMPETQGPIDLEAAKANGTHDTALLIPCYKSENIIGPTLDAALKIFPAKQIFVISNGNSPTPLDNTEEVCIKYGVNFIWSPVGSKIVAQFVGCFAAKQYKNVLLIDDDCALPPNFPIVSDRMKGKIKCIGYTIKSVGPESSKGTYCQQAQDLEYKLSGLQRGFAGMIGSATFPHGAISIWNTEFLISTFYQHPGYSVSEDWFFGHAARQLGCRITMCTSVFVETETPSAIFFSSGGSRGGFGEMTVFKQRFMRWNFFFVTGIAYNMDYILRSWKLGWWEIGAKLFVFQEVYETLLYLLAPFIMPISLIIRPAFTAYLFAGVFGLYLVNTIIFNEVHLRLKNERIGWKAAYPYYTSYKMILLAVNIASCYWAIWKYATYFAKRHPMIIEDEKAIDVVLRLEEQQPEPSQTGTQGRRMTVAAIGSQLRDYSMTGGQDGHTPARKMTLMTFGPRLSHAVISGNKERRGTTAVLVEEPSTYDPLEPIKWEDPFALAQKSETTTTFDSSDNDGFTEAGPNSPVSGFAPISLGLEAGPGDDRPR